MNRRRRVNPASSLDLFLDTICNAFAGIMFIAILLSIVTQLQSKTINKSSLPSSDVQRLEGLLRQLAELESVLESVKRLANAGSVEDLAVEQNRLKQSLDKLAAVTTAHSDSLRELERVVKKNEMLSKELATLDEELARMREDVENRGGELEGLKAERIVSIDLPEVKTTDKGNLLFLMRYGECFSVHKDGDASFNTAQVTVNNELGGNYVRPKAGSGWDLTQPQESAALSQFLRTFSTSEHVVTVGVWPDSFAQFATFKKKLIDLGYEYELVPLEAIDRVPIGSNPGQAKVQ